jgi:hypothetical protein
MNLDLDREIRQARWLRADATAAQAMARQQVTETRILRACSADLMEVMDDCVVRLGTFWPLFCDPIPGRRGPSRPPTSRARSGR